MLILPKHKQDVLTGLLRDPVSLHMFFFSHRHPDPHPTFHRDIICAIHDLSVTKFQAITFRGSGKSTLMEECMILLSLLGIIRNGIVIGESETRAAERLNAIKHELETNERIIDFFGPQRAEPWTSTRAALSSGAYLQAYGRGQSLRGAKHLDNRPNFAFLDDIESEDSVNTPEAIQKTMRWITATLFPAMSKTYYVRMAATPLHPNAACVQLSKDKSFVTRTVPVFYYNSLGRLTSAWPERNPLDEMLEKQQEYERLGMAREFGQEYLCEAETSETKAFDTTTLKVSPSLIRTFQPTILAVDPSRTTKSTSSLTGIAVGSWQSNDLILWEADGYTIRPSDIIDLIFKLSEQYNPTYVIIDKTGLELFLMQPLQVEMARRGALLPIVPAKNPKNKLDFIRSLQPFITAQQLQLAKPMPTLQAQLHNFPSGKIDVLNAVAYLLQAHPGEPVYQNFIPDQHTLASPMATLPKGWPVVHCLNSTPTETAGASITLLRREIIVLADSVVQGNPISAGPECLQQLRMQTSYQGVICIPRKHFQQFDTLGLKASLMQNRDTPSMGGEPGQGRTEIQEAIDIGRFRISSDALYSLRAFTGGVAYDKDRSEPRKNYYATLAQAIESGVQILKAQTEREDGNWAISRSGKRFLSSRA